MSDNTVTKDNINETIDNFVLFFGVLSILFFPVSLIAFGLYIFSNKSKSKNAILGISISIFIFLTYTLFSILWYLSTLI